MTRSPFTDEQLNVAINTAARRMTSAAPSSDLCARVMTQIDVPRPRWGWRLAVAGASIASVAIVIATQLVSPKPAPSAIVAVASPMATGRVSPKPTPEASAQADPTTAASVSSPVVSNASVRQTATRRETIAMSVAEIEWRARAVQALELPNALHVEPLEHPRLNIDSIDITPLSVAPLTVPALGNDGSK